MSFWFVLLRTVILPLCILLGVLMLVPIWIWLERRVCARIQQRIGPNRVGPTGLLQPIADAVKLLFKEDITPSHVDPLIFLAAPLMSLMPAMLALAVVPFGGQVTVHQYLFWGPPVERIPIQICDVNVGILVILALSSMAVYGVVLAGWSSNNKWSLMGGVRAAAQMVSYELAVGLAVLAVILNSSTWLAGGQHGAALSLRTAVESQAGLSVLGWNILWQAPAFVIFAVGAVAESNRAPFDLPEAEQELVAGFHTEYSAFRFAMFFMGEYVHMTTLSAVATSLFLGGWLSPFAGIPLLSALNVSQVPVLAVLAPIAWFVLKIFLCMFCMIWIRWTLPRMRWDQLMRLGWLVMLPAGLVWVVVVAFYQAIGGVLASWTGMTSLEWYRLLFALTAVAVGAILYYRKLVKPAPGEA